MIQFHNQIYEYNDMFVQFKKNYDDCNPIYIVYKYKCDTLFCKRERKKEKEQDTRKLEKKLRQG